MRAVQRNVVADQIGHSGVRGARERPQPAPEQPMVHEQEVRALGRGESYRRSAQVDRGGDARHLPRILDLKAVQGVGRVRHLTDEEVTVEVAGELFELHKDVSAGSVKTS